MNLTANAAVASFFASLRAEPITEAASEAESRTPVLDRIRGTVAVALVAAVLAPTGAQAQSLGINTPTVMGILGAAGGALGGSQIGRGAGKTAAIAVGTLLGAGLGWEGGKYLDSQGDAAKAALNQAHVGQRVAWQDQGAAGYFMPVRDGVSARTGLQCREYQTEIVVGGQRQVGYGTACLQPDGHWQIMSSGQARQGAQFGQAPQVVPMNPHMWGATHGQAMPGYASPGGLSYGSSRY